MTLPEHLFDDELTINRLPGVLKFRPFKIVCNYLLVQNTKKQKLKYIELSCIFFYKIFFEFFVGQIAATPTGPPTRPPTTGGIFFSFLLILSSSSSRLSYLFCLKLLTKLINFIFERKK
jgi:hypothetical protein